MSTPAAVLSCLVLISGALHIYAEYFGPRWRVYLFKPATTTLVVLLALQTTPVSAAYKALIVVGLLFSLAGDIFLMWPQDRFMAGLASFLLAHLCYIAAFSTRSGFHGSAMGLLPFLLYGGVMLGVLWPHIGAMRGPVVIYVATILLMGWQALEQWRWTQQTGALLALVGALLFVFSDSILALDRFRSPFRSARLLALSSYYLAQWFIALSVAA